VVDLDFGRVSSVFETNIMKGRAKKSLPGFAGYYRNLGYYGKKGTTRVPPSWGVCTTCLKNNAILGWGRESENEDGKRRGVWHTRGKQET